MLAASNPAFNACRPGKSRGAEFRMPAIKCIFRHEYVRLGKPVSYLQRRLNNSAKEKFKKRKREGQKIKQVSWSWDLQLTQNCKTFKLLLDSRILLFKLCLLPNFIKVLQNSHKNLFSFWKVFLFFLQDSPSTLSPGLCRLNMTHSRRKLLAGTSTQELSQSLKKLWA